MSVKQLPNGEWFYRFNLKKQSHRRQGFRTKAEAESAETLKKAEALRRPAVGADYDDNLKLCQASEMFFEEYVRPFKRNWKGDRAHIRIINEFFGRRRIKDLTPRDVDAFRPGEFPWRRWRRPGSGS